MQNFYIKRMEERLGDDARDMLRRIYEPTVVAAPLSDARRDVCILKDGEIRSYGYLYGKKAHSGDGQSAYLSSKDCGISWTKHYSKGVMNSSTYIERADVYLGVSEQRGDEVALFVKRSAIGPDDPSPEFVKVMDGKFRDSFLPQESAFGNRVWFTTQKIVDSGPEGPETLPVFVFSDDFGKSWNVRILQKTPPFEIKYPHKSLRWCIASGAEPHATELSENKMMMIIRSPHDCFYVSYSYDGGDTWSKPEPSTFYGTNTTAYLLRLSDGRLIAFWNNTSPLPQPDYDKQVPPVHDNVRRGLGENAFTNRDAAHAAISDDCGKTFSGYREFFLNPIRSNTDFRYIGGLAMSNDKSVHQFQAYELPYGKVLVCLGQNVSARLLIFDINWLYETSAEENFVKNALEKITTHTYVKSLSGHTAHIAGNGHCAWNRAPAAYLLPDPDGSLNEVLNISSHKDQRLYNNIGGAVWNFPASKKGCVTVELKLSENKAVFTLTDRWYNACDAYCRYLSPFSFEIDAKTIGTSYVKISIEYDTENETASVFSNGNKILDAKAKFPAPTGISYLVMQCASEGDSEGFYVKSLKKE